VIACLARACLGAFDFVERTFISVFGNVRSLLARVVFCSEISFLLNTVFGPFEVVLVFIIVAFAED